MYTKVVNVRDMGDNALKAVYEAASLIKGGGLVAFPTETVYGLGANGLDKEAAKKIYSAKGRPSDNPLILHIADFSELEELTAEIPEAAVKLAKRYWPGPLTMIFKKSAVVPFETTGGLDTVAIRLPENKVARELIKRAGVPIAAPSANLSGRPSPTTAEHVAEDMSGRIEMILDGGAVGIGIESTIIDVTGERPVILRPGFITGEMLAEVLGEVETDFAVTGEINNNDIRPKAPGMKYRHYAPKGKMIIYEGELSEIIRKINEEAEKAEKDGLITAVLATDETMANYKADYVFSVGRRADIDEVAHRLFDVLRKFDEVGAEAIFSESFSDKGLGFAVMNRLRKAAGYNIIQIIHEM